MEELIHLIALFFGVQPEVIIALLPTLVFLFNFTSRLIPDDATGVLGVVGKACAILGMHVSNRVSSGVTVNDLAQFTLDKEAPKGHAPGFEPRPNGFSVTSQLFALLIGSLVLTLILGGCSNQGVEKVKAVTCANKEKVRAAANMALAVVNQCDSGLLSGGQEGVY